jgi:transcription elongation factor Elf1
MAEIKYMEGCNLCGEHEAVKVIVKQTAHSRSIKVLRCSVCGEQNNLKNYIS